MKKNEFGIDGTDRLYAVLAAMIDSMDEAPPNSMVGAVVDRRLITQGKEVCAEYLKEKRRGELARKKYGEEH